MMIRISPFDRLVSGLSKKEREELLARIESSVRISSSPVMDIRKDPDEQVDIEEEYSRLPFFPRFFIWIKSILGGNSREELMEAALYLKLRKRIEKGYPGIVDFKNNLFLSGMFDKLKNLLDAVTFFRSSVLPALGKHRGIFFTFLANEELNDIDRKIEEAIEPEAIQSEMQYLDVQNIRAEMMNKLEEVIDGIEEADRIRVYNDVIILQSLYNLCLFRIEDIAGKFKQPFGASEYTVPFNDISRLITELTCRLYSFKIPPNAKLLQILFFFSYQEKNSGDYGFADDLTSDLMHSEEKLNAIRDFNRTVPLLDISRYLLRDLNYRPEIMRGGEDWFFYFKKFWEKRLDYRFRVFRFNNRRREIIKEIAEFFRMEKFEFPLNYRDNISGYNIHAAFPVSIGFLQNFYDRFFSVKINTPLKILVLNGEFYKEENRVEFTDSFNGTVNIKEDLKRLYKDFGKTGKYGIELSKIRNELIKTGLKEKQVNIIVENADKDAESIINNSLVNLGNLVKILDGVLYGEVGGKYDTISNYGDINGSRNKNYIDSLKSIIKILDKSVVLLNKVYKLEKSRPATLIDSN
ncbi:MAG: hypothetical protein GXP33_14790 [Spirochaetes bacterium]|nr:hypothetical protein [Spirochaetota bacterium]